MLRVLGRRVVLGRCPSTLLLRLTRPAACRTRLLSTVSPTSADAAAAGAKSNDLAEALATEPKDTRPWVVRNPLTTLFFAIVGSWAYSLWCQNRTRKLQDAVEDEVRGRAPINEDELLELRALNDVSTATIAALPSAAAAIGCSKSIRADQLLQLLRRNAASGQPLKEEYALERMLMAIPHDGPALDVCVTAGTLAVLSTGPVAERLEAIFELLAEGTGTARQVPADRLLSLLEALRRTGQMPPEKYVLTVDEGKNALGLGRDWYTIQPVREYSAQDWCDTVLRGEVAADSAAEVPAEPTAPTTSVDIVQFIELMTSPTVCLWGECYRIAERKRQQKLRDDAEEARHNPSFSTRAWNTITGGGGDKPADPAAS